jgi:N-acetyl-anhydromuramyl-L-alanine amidase AmpD
MWCPLAEAVTPHMRTRGKYADRYPRGAVVHYTAGHDRSEEDARASLSFGREQGYCFFVIGPTGRIYQSFPLDEWGYHAGESAWLGLGTNVSSKLVGIEVACAGLLDADRKSWFGTTYLQSETRRLAASSGHGGPAGTYRSFRAQQEEALIGLLRWLKSNNPAVFDCRNVLGHHEVSGELGIGRWRKQDPGGALSMPMDQLRALL